VFDNAQKRVDALGLSARMAALARRLRLDPAAGVDRARLYEVCCFQSPLLRLLLAACFHFALLPEVLKFACVA
jgi:hypothetical protein